MVRSTRADGNRKDHRNPGTSSRDARRHPTTCGVFSRDCAGRPKRLDRATRWLVALELTPPWTDTCDISARLTRLIAIEHWLWQLAAAYGRASRSHPLRIPPAGACMVLDARRPRAGARCKRSPHPLRRNRPADNNGSAKAKGAAALRALRQRTPRSADLARARGCARWGPLTGSLATNRRGGVLAVRLAVVLEHQARSYYLGVPSGPSGSGERRRRGDRDADERQAAAARRERRPIPGTGEALKRPSRHPACGGRGHDHTTRTSRSRVASSASLNALLGVVAVAST